MDKKENLSTHKCPKCKEEQPVSDSCIHCGIIFSKIKAAPEPSKQKSPPPSTPHKNIGENIFFCSMCVIFVSVLFARSIYFLEFSEDWDIYFRILMLPAMGWLTFAAIPRAASLLKKFEDGSDTKWGLDGFEVYKKKAIFVFLTLGSAMLLYVFYAVLSGSVECFSGRNRTCHEIYDSIADTREFWASILITYFVSLIPLTVGYMGWLIRGERE